MHITMHNSAGMATPWNKNGVAPNIARSPSCSPRPAAAAQGWPLMQAAMPRHRLLRDQQSAARQAPWPWRGWCGDLDVAQRRPPGVAATARGEAASAEGGCSAPHRGRAERCPSTVEDLRDNAGGCWFMNKGHGELGPRVEIAFRM